MHLLKISWLAVLRLTSADVATGHSMGYLESQKFLRIRDDKSFGFAMEFLLIQFVKMPILHPRVISMIILVILFMARWLRNSGLFDLIHKPSWGGHGLVWMASLWFAGASEFEKGRPQRSLPKVMHPVVIPWGLGLQTDDWSFLSRNMFGVRRVREDSACDPTKFNS